MSTLGHCRECGSPIRFRKLPNGRYCPTEPDGTDHFDVCSARRYDRLKRDGERVEVKRAGVVMESGYALNGAYQRDFIRGAPITGAFYFRMPCVDSCTVPPWEDCLSCPHAALRVQFEQQSLNVPTKRSSAHGKRKQSNSDRQPRAGSGDPLPPQR